MRSKDRGGIPENKPSQSAPIGRVQIPLFVTYGDIFPRNGGSLSSQGELTPSVIAYGDATFPKGTALAVVIKLPAAPKGSPLGELALRSKD